MRWDIEWKNIVYKYIYAVSASNSLSFNSRVHEYPLEKSLISSISLQNSKFKFQISPMPFKSQKYSVMPLLIKIHANLMNKI